MDYPAAFPPPSVRASTEKNTVARFAISSAVLPRITRAFFVAGHLHQTLVKHADDLSCAPIFTGKGADGNTDH